MSPLSANAPIFEQSKSLDIRSQRLALKLRQSELAEIASVNLDDLKRWERGFELPSSQAISRLSRVLGCAAKDLLDTQKAFLKDAIPGEGYTTARSDTSEIFPRRNLPAKDKLKMLDLFCGSGGFSFGFEQTGRFAVTAGIDLLPDRIRTFTTNHPSAASIVGDIRSFSVEQLGYEALSPQIVIAGPPCQGFSSIRPFRMCTAGDPRNNLFEYFVLAISALRPRWFVLENVVGLLTHDKGQSINTLLSSLQDAGYRTDWRVFNAANFGLPQNRERLIFVGNRENRPFEWPAPTHFASHRSMAGKGAKKIMGLPLFSPPLTPAVTVMEAIHDLPELEAGQSSDRYQKDVALTDYEREMRGGSKSLTLHEATAHSEKMLDIIRRAGANRWALPEGLTSSGFSSSYSRLDPDQPSVTLTVNFVHPASNKCIHPFQHRALTPREGARLQGFPDQFNFCGNRSQVVKQIGNAVPPLLGRVIAESIARQW